MFNYFSKSFLAKWYISQITKLFLLQNYQRSELPLLPHCQTSKVGKSCRSNIPQVKRRSSNLRSGNIQSAKLPEPFVYMIFTNISCLFTFKFNSPIGSSYSYCRNNISGSPLTSTANAVSETKGRKMTGVAGMTSVLSIGELTELELCDSVIILRLSP